MSNKNIKTDHRSIVALKLPHPIPALVAYAQQIVKAMTGNPAFPTPVPALSVVTAAIDDLQSAETSALTRVKGAVVTRNEKRTALLMLLQQLRGYIQTQADANVENGASIYRERRGRSEEAVGAGTTRLRREARTRLRHDEARRAVGRDPRFVRVAVQHGRRQDLGARPRHAPGQDDHRRPDAWSDRAGDPTTPTDLRGVSERQADPNAPSDSLPPRVAAASEPSDAELERAIVEAVMRGAMDVARMLSARLEARQPPAQVVDLASRRR
jgi:hypothetical protein